MNLKWYPVFFVILSISLLLGLVACDVQEHEKESVLRVGVIASLSGPARPWGLVTVRCAQVIADYYNEQGGFDLDGEKVRIELLVRDDALHAAEAASIAHELIEQEVHYVIGPLGDAAVEAAARVLDAAGVFYVHYGFKLEVQNPSSLGVLGMPQPEQSLPVLLNYLRSEKDLSSVLVFGYGTEEGILQKQVAESVVIGSALDLIKLSRFDVSEETFDIDLEFDRVRRKVARIVRAAPDVLILAGCPPEAFVALVDRLRDGGFSGVIAAQNAQNPSLLLKLGAFANDVYYVGGVPELAFRSQYYEDLKLRYLDTAEEWNSESDTKLYALEFILACIREAGPAALEETSVLYRAIQRIHFQDPFYQDTRFIPVLGGIDDGLPRQIQTPIRISKIQDGQAVLVQETVQTLKP
jgi:branched-chain amino acid transport system substrate-binding protein